MSTSGSNDIQVAIARAAELVEKGPEDLRQIAFSKAFDALIGTESFGPAASSGPAPAAQRKAARPRGGAQQTIASDAVAIAAALDSTAHPEIASGKPARELALRVLKAAREGTETEWLTPNDVWTILRDKFRVSVKLNAINMALFRAGTLIDRRKQDDTYVYRIMGAGEEYLAKIDTGEDARPIASKRTSIKPRQASKRPKKDAAAKIADASGAMSTISKARSSGLPGPKATLESLITSGYFDEPRTMSDVIKHVQVKQARAFTASDLGPTFVRLQREKKLDRERNGEGQYEYRRHPDHA